MPCLYTILYWAQASEVSMHLVKNSNFGFAICFTEISILKLLKTGWFPNSTQNTLYTIWYWVNEQNEQVHSENKKQCLKTDFI